MAIKDSNGIKRSAKEFAAIELHKAIESVTAPKGGDFSDKESAVIDVQLKKYQEKIRKMLRIDKLLQKS